MIPEISCDYCGAANSTASSFCHACGRPFIMLNQRYHQLHKLGGGGQGEVYGVEDTKLANSLRAAKKLQLSDISSPQAKQETIDAFKQEATMLANLKHPNLPEIYDYLEENNDHYLIMEFIPGETLEDRLKKAGQQLLPVEEVLRIGIELATVLDYLHTRTPPIIFRDLKPENIMITPDGRLYLIDFGIARHFKPGQKKDTTALGSEGYAPPEQHGSTQTTAQADIYSLGAIMHRMLTGDNPADSPFNFVPLTGQMPDMQHLIKSMLSIPVRQRPASANEVKQKFQQILQGLQQPTGMARLQTRQLTLPANQASSAPSKKTKIFQQIAPASTISSQPSLPKKQGELHSLYTHTPRTIWALAWSPDSLHLAVAGEGPNDVSVWQASTGITTHIYKGHKRPIQALAWSPDSHYLASASNDCTIHVWEALTGKNQRIYLNHTNLVQTLAWSPDGTLLASGDANGSIHIWNAQTGLQHMLYQDHKAQILALAFSPAGTLIASTEDSNQHVIQIWETLSGKSQTMYTGHKKTISSLAWSPDGKQIVSGSWDTTLHIWEADTGQQLLCYKGHQRLINAVAWSPTTNLIASASKDKTVHIWHPQNGQEHFIYRGHTSSVNALAWSPDGIYLASAGDEPAVHVWRAN